MTDLPDEPLDESTLWASDALLGALAAGSSVAADDPAAHLMAALMADVSADMGDAPALPGPLAVRRQRSGLRRIAPRSGIAVAALVVVLSTGGVAAASVNAGPTSALFPLHQVLTGQPQLDGSQRDALEIRHKLTSAVKALAAGKVESAQRDVAAAAGRLAKVKPTDGHRDLTVALSAVTDAVVKAHSTAAATTHPVVTHPATPKPTHSRTPVPAPTTTTPQPAPTTPILTLPPVVVAPATPAVPTTTAPPTPDPAPTTSATPSPSVTPTTTPTVGVTPSPTVSTTPTPTPSGTGTGTGKHRHRKGGGASGSATPTATPTVTSPRTTLSPAGGQASAVPSTPPGSAAPVTGAPATAWTGTTPPPSAYASGSVPTSSISPPASSTPSANPRA